MQSIKSINVMSCAKTMGAFYGAVGLLVIPFLLIAGLASFAGGKGANAIAGVVMVVFGILAPVFYGGLGFLFGAFGAWVYNQIARRLGGIQIELQQTPASATSNQFGLI
jgi:hypothetical protein